MYTTQTTVSNNMHNHTYTCHKKPERTVTIRLILCKLYEIGFILVQRLARTR